MNYCRIARFYRTIEALFIGRSLLNARVAHLSRLAQTGPIKHALLVGEGNGSFLLPFAQQFSQARITVIDGSPEMLRIARSRLADAGLLSARIEFQVADMTTVSLPQCTYDLLVTHFFFDNFSTSQAEHMIATLEQASTINAQWLLADYCMPLHGWRAWRAAMWLRALYTFFGLFAAVPVRSLPEIETALAASSFKRINRKTYSAGMLRSDYYQRA
jgi:SAM-dependent methyltransferase